MSGALTYEAIGWFIAVMVPVMGGFFFGWRLIVSSIRRVEENARAERDRMASVHRAELKELTIKQERLSADFAAYKLDAAGRFAAVGHIRDVESRLTNSIDKLTNRIDKLLTRMDKDA